jgi:hypothetical protein
VDSSAAHPDPEPQPECARVGEPPARLRITRGGRLRLLSETSRPFALTTGTQRLDTCAVEATVFAGD